MKYTNKLPEPPPDRIFTEEEGPPECKPECPKRGWTNRRISLALFALAPFIGIGMFIILRWL